MKQKAQDSITAAWAFFNQQKLIKSLLNYIFYKVTFSTAKIQKKIVGLIKKS